MIEHAGILRAPRRAALIVIALIVTVASLVSFAESYRGLYLWARGHLLGGVWAAGFPAQIDVFIAIGELALFVALVDRWPVRSRIGAWAVTLAGLAVSVAANVGHVAGASAATRVTDAVPPLAAAASLAIGLGVLKRVVGAHHGAPVALSGDQGMVSAAPDKVSGDVLATVPVAQISGAQAGALPMAPGRIEDAAPDIEAAAPDIEDTELDTQDMTADKLAGATTKADRVRIVRQDVLNRTGDPATVVAALRARGYVVSEDTARKTINRDRAASNGHPR